MLKKLLTFTGVLAMLASCQTLPTPPRGDNNDTELCDVVLGEPTIDPAPPAVDPAVPGPGGA